MTARRDGIPDRPDALPADELARLNQELADYQWLFHTAGEAVILLDEEARFIDCSQRYVDLYGFASKAELAAGYPENVATERQPDGRSTYEKAYEYIQRVHEQGSAAFEWLHRRVDGEEFLSYVRLERIRFGGRPCIRGVVEDISTVRSLAKPAEERVRKLADQYRELETLSLIDPLTGVYNRRKFDAVMPYAWDAAQRAGQALGILFIDIDFFKPYNDHYGHAAGDACLKVVAERIGNCTRRRTDFVVRYGGEEFVVILPEVNEERLAERAEAIRQAVAEAAVPHAYSPVADHVTISIGGAWGAPDCDCMNHHTLVESADRMLYQAKSAGRDRVELQRCGEDDGAPRAG